ncbi:YqaJ viral recombinase family protein [Rhodococcoides fascians]|uniref:YqaJ viral recombinase family protein n=1 Tax=Rhodococcoides fascians TaxID=1828 RepID=UPI00068D9618|nr:YqaJ viral recombinase family protein [Rhodococcus fascians]
MTTATPIASDSLILPGSAEWLRYFSASKVAALPIKLDANGEYTQGFSRWESPFSLWHRMSGHLAPEDPKDDFTVGHAAELMLAALYLHVHSGWKLSPGEVQFVRELHGIMMMATLDRRAVRGSHRRVVEFKKARSLEEFGDDGSDEVPADYFMQVQWQMGVSGYTKFPAHLMVGLSFFDRKIYEIPFDPDVFDFLVAAAVKFNQSLVDGIEPALDDSTPTYETIRELHPDIDGTAVYVDVEDAIELLNSAASFEASEAFLRGCKSSALKRMGNAQYLYVQDPGGDHKKDVKVADRRKNGHGSVSFYVNKKADLAAITGGTA